MLKKTEKIYYFNVFLIKKILYTVLSNINFQKKKKVKGSVARMMCRYCFHNLKDLNWTPSIFITKNCN